MKPILVSLPNTLAALDAEGLRRKQAGDGRLIAIVERGKVQVAKEFPSTVKQAADPKNKVAQTEVSNMIMKLVGKRAEKFLKANP